MKYCHSFLLMLLFLFIACQDESMIDKEHGESNTWLLYERGYSPGAGYIIEPVPAEPAQTITFYPDGTFSSTMPMLEDYQAYKLEDDVLTVIKTDKPLPEQVSLDYTYEQEGDQLRLSLRFCIEGCHLGFKRVY